MKKIDLKRLGRVKDLEKFDAELKDSLESMQMEFALDTFCKAGGYPTDANFYQIELKAFGDKRAVGVIHLSFIERLKPNAEAKRGEKHHHLRYGFELDRSSGDLQLGKGFLRT